LVVGAARGEGDIFGRPVPNIVWCQTVRQRGLVALFLGAMLAAGTAAQPAFDLVVRGGRIVDGSGGPPAPADVGIRGVRIAAVGELDAGAARVIDARGLIVAPGFIDVHAHADNIASRPQAENFVAMGVTTIVSGNCGYSNADIAAHLAHLERIGCSLNYGTLIGHGTIRTAALGTADRAPTPTELAAMRGLLRAALEAGALGMSTGLIYVPGTYADTDELAALAEELAAAGAIYASHLRNENARVLDAIDEALQIAKRTGVAVHLSHLKVSGKGNWGRARAIVDLLRDARVAGLRVSGDQYAYTAASTSIDVLFPAAELAIGGRAFAARLAGDPEFRARMRTALDATMQQAGFGDLSYCRIAHAPGNADLDGLTLPEAAGRRSGRSDADAQAELALELVVAARGRRITMIYHTIDDGDVETLMREPWIAIAADAGITSRTDAGKPHPRAAGNNPRVLARYVREKGVLDLPLAIHKMTGLPAASFGLEDRGAIRAGAFADLTIFDADTVVDRATFAEPLLAPQGIRWVIVNGTPVVADGAPTGARPGSILRRTARGSERDR
jgi:N-acyl-D-amino-acid deacylase